LFFGDTIELELMLLYKPLSWDWFGS